MKASRRTKLSLINKHFRSNQGKEYTQKKIINNKLEALEYMKKKNLGRF